jgi:hypothetical protein
LFNNPSNLRVFEEKVGVMLLEEFDAAEDGDGMEL